MDNCRKTPQRVDFLPIRTFTKNAPPQRPEELLNVIFKLLVVPGVGIIPLAHGAHPDELCFSELFERERSQMIGDVWEPLLFQQRSGVVKVLSVISAGLDELQRFRLEWCH